MDASTLSRRGFVVASVAAVAGLARGRAASAATVLQSALPAAPGPFRSRPDLSPPRLSVNTRRPGGAGGYVFVAPFTGQQDGTALIVDDAGEPIWVYESPKLVMNFKVQHLFGQPVLTWWEGTIADGFFVGECVIADESYRVLHRLSAGNGFRPEVHEFLITSRGSVLLSINNFVSTDLTPYDGPVDGTVIEGVVQELDIESGEVVFEWHSLDHVGLDETSFPVSRTWDYFHLNSIDVDGDGDLVVSARYPCAVYKVDRASGAVVWRLGGTKSDFSVDPGARFWFQHDARSLPGGLLSLFDDGADSAANAPESVSRAIVLALDETAMTARLVASYPNPAGALTVAMGSAQVLHGDGCFVGWGTVPQVTEFDALGNVVFDAAFPGGQSTYRAVRSQWAGHAPGRPAVAAVRNADGSTDLYASWNGSTRVSSWQALDRTKPGAKALAVARREGFETRIRVGRPASLMEVAALDRHGRVVGTSPVVAL